jgi:thymidylate synthase
MNTMERSKDISASKMFTNANSVSSATISVLEKLLNEGDVIPSRDGDTLELSPHTVVISGNHPHTMISHRGNSPFATIAETLWVWAGRGDLKTLVSRWLPRASDYSDDWDLSKKDGTWRAAYGPRLRYWQCKDGSNLDQLEVVIRRMLKSPGTRQALMTLPNPEWDQIEGSKDYPCNLIVHFLVRGGQLNMHVYIRSNDTVFGFCINTFEWMFIGDYVASRLGLPFGKYHHTASSLHMYTARHKERARKMVGCYIPHPIFPSGDTGLSNISPSELRDLCNEAFETGRLEVISERAPAKILDYSRALYAENAIIADDPSAFVNLAKQISDTNLLASILEMGQRRLKTPLFNHVELQDRVVDFPELVEYLEKMYNTILLEH